MQVRDTARIVLLNSDSRVLLIRIQNTDVVDPTNPIRKPFWITPGGRIEEGECPEATVRRELLEETGISSVEMGPQVWYGEHELDWKGTLTLLRERFFVARTKEAVICTTGMSQEERQVYRDHRWWDARDIQVSLEPFVPIQMGNLIQPLIERCYPSVPIRIDLSTPN